MAAVTRWVNYDVDAVGSAIVSTIEGIGTVGHSFGTDTISSGIDIGPTTNRLYLTLDGSYEPTDPVDSVAGYITLHSGTGLDPRFVARDITEKLHASAATERFTHATCLWEDCYDLDATDYFAYTAFKIYSGTRGSASSVTVATSGTNSAHAQLGFTSGNVVSEGGTLDNLQGSPNTSDCTITISGVYRGFFDEEYMVVISNNNNDATNEVRGVDIDNVTTTDTYAGTVTWGGMYNGSANATYTLTINVANGTTMGGGRGNVPRMSWTGGPSNDDMKAGQWIELLYPNFWYSVGTKGLKVKFTDAVFSGGAWTIPVKQAALAQGANANSPIGTARYMYASTRGQYIDAHVATPASGVYGALGTTGLYITITGSTNLYAGDEFRISCAGPHPGAQANYDISSLNYGNVTVSTDSAVKSVMFEIKSGAEEMSTVKFGLQSNGTFSHHTTGNNDTYFRFGTVGPATIKNGYEWYPDIAYTDIDSDTPPAFLYATEDNLSVVSTADASETVGNYPLVGLTSDPMWLTVHLGASETGANSTINYRLYFDYS